MPPLNGGANKERTGYPTQKPIALYDRIIRASSNEGDWVLDPFAGCATTCVAAERAGRKWIGIDLWEKAVHVTRERLERESTLGGKAGMLTSASILHRTDVPDRTDAHSAAMPYLKTPDGQRYRRRFRMTRDQIKRSLWQTFGHQCWACTFVAPDIRYLEMDRIVPGVEGGAYEFNNVALLCSPVQQGEEAYSNDFGLA